MMRMTVFMPQLWYFNSLLDGGKIKISRTKQDTGIFGRIFFFFFNQPTEFLKKCFLTSHERPRQLKINAGRGPQTNIFLTKSNNNFYTSQSWPKVNHKWSANQIWPWIWLIHPILKTPDRGGGGTQIIFWRSVQPEVWNPYPYLRIFLTQKMAE